MAALVFSQDEVSIMDSILQDIRLEQPKIDVSVKNFLSVLIAKGQKDTPITSSNSAVDTIVDLPPHFLMDYAKLFLSCLQQVSIKEYSDFFATNIQSESQSASDRLDQMCRYKAYSAYRQHIIQSGGKLSKHFGKSYFLCTEIWPAIKTSFISRLEAGENSRLTVGEGRQFIDLYEKGLFESDNKKSDFDLIWSSNFQESLRKRHAERLEVATKRANDAMADAMRNAVHDTQSLRSSNDDSDDEKEIRDA